MAASGLGTRDKTMTSEHARAAVFAADGLGRHRLVRAATAAGVALLAAWLIALALGVLGGFDALPGLPSANPHNSASTAPHSHPASTPAVPEVHRSAPTQTVAPVQSTGARPTTSQGSVQRTTMRAVAPTTAATANTTSGRRLGTTKPSGKPVESPGNGPGGSGAPGQLR
jgi:hypothetical protein